MLCTIFSETPCSLSLQIKVFMQTFQESNLTNLSNIVEKKYQVIFVCFKFKSTFLIYFTIMMQTSSDGKKLLNMSEYAGLEESKEKKSNCMTNSARLLVLRYYILINNPVNTSF